VKREHQVFATPVFRIHRAAKAGGSTASATWTGGTCVVVIVGMDGNAIGKRREARMDFILSQ